MRSLKWQAKKARDFFFPAKLNEMAFFAFMSHGNAASLKKAQQFLDEKLSLNENRPLVLMGFFCAMKTWLAAAVTRENFSLCFSGLKFKLRVHTLHVCVASSAGHASLALSVHGSYLKHREIHRSILSGIKHK